MLCPLERVGITDFLVCPYSPSPSRIAGGHLYAGPWRRLHQLSPRIPLPPHSLHPRSSVLSLEDSSAQSSIPVVIFVPHLCVLSTSRQCSNRDKLGSSANDNGQGKATALTSPDTIHRLAERRDHHDHPREGGVSSAADNSRRGALNVFY
ncbi:hypothetical protein BKA70DRAFT_1286991 [Coprinopsis sp. MPI-PUGE-AT-0042]|nr:hypothetical protein BKA70DRAFT_1286991 [Coprinopsis sp. MPI-PUGE-AT-0042]